MSWSSRLARAAFIALSLSALTGLSACSGLRPVYGDIGGGTSAYLVNYAAPGSRLDQIIYNELRLRLGAHSDSPQAVRVSVRSYYALRALTRTEQSVPGTPWEVTVTSAISAVSPTGEILFSGTRTASSVYNTVGQVLADTTAQTDAAERAARSMADIVRLSLLGAFNRGPRPAGG